MAPWKEGDPIDSPVPLLTTFLSADALCPASEAGHENPLHWLGHITIPDVTRKLLGHDAGIRITATPRSLTLERAHASGSA